MAELVGSAEVGAGGKALAVVGQLRVKYRSMPAGRRKGLVGGGSLLLVAVLAMVWWATRPDYRVLFSGLEGKDVQQVAQELGGAGIPFQMTADGSGVEVPADMVDKARMEVASKGMPQSGRLGFELFDKPNWVGSEFDERVNYQRAMEGELEHTIATLGVVRSARVHLVLPQPSLFSSEEKLAKASVVLKLKRASLDREQTEAIRNLVAGAVENLSPEQVTLVDADGRVNLAAQGHSAEAGDEEHALEGKLIAMLEPLAGPGNIRATVNVSYEQGTEERTDEVYDPAQSAVLTTQKSEQSSGGSRTAGGVPGTASNTPAAAPAGAVQGSAAAAAPGTPPLLAGQTLPVYPQSGAGAAQSTKEESGTYAVTRHLLHSERGPGRVRRLTAAVVVNDRMVADVAVANDAKANKDAKDSKTTWKPRTAEEMHRLETLAQAAVGFDEKRGDQVVMENIGFSTNVPEAAVTGSAKLLEQARALLPAQPAMLKTATMGVLGLLVVLFVLKPVAGQVVASMREPLLMTSGGATGSAGGDAFSLGGAQSRGGVAATAGGEWLEPEQMPKAPPGIFDQVSAHIKHEPQHSTRLLEAWMASDGEGD